MENEYEILYDPIGKMQFCLDTKNTTISDIPYVKIYDKSRFHLTPVCAWVSLINNNYLPFSGWILNKTQRDNLVTFLNKKHTKLNLNNWQVILCSYNEKFNNMKYEDTIKYRKKFKLKDKIFSIAYPIPDYIKLPKRVS